MCFFDIPFLISICLFIYILLRVAHKLSFLVIAGQCVLCSEICDFYKAHCIAQIPQSGKESSSQSRSARSRHTDGYFPLFTVAWLVQYYLLHSPQSKLIFWSIEARSLKFVLSVSSCYSSHLHSCCSLYQPVVSTLSTPVLHDIYSCSQPAPACSCASYAGAALNIAMTFP